MSFSSAIVRILKHEGGFVNDPKDTGGETNFGISKRAYPNEDIKNLTVERAKEIYKRDYWDKFNGDALENIAIATEILDTAVNMGVKTTIKMAQIALEITADGIVGDKTIESLNNIDAELFLLRFKLLRINRYVHICKKNPDNKKFFYGWITRAVGV